jgi:hypothetical protein
MSAFIKLNKQDAFVAPYTAHKSYAYSTNQTRIDAGIRFQLGTRFTGSREDNITNLNRFYSSVKQLYYSNYSSSLESGSFENYNQSTLHFTRSLGDSVAIISIPQFLYGENIKPGTFQFRSGSFKVADDKEGNLKISGSVDFDEVTETVTHTQMQSARVSSVNSNTVLVLKSPGIPLGTNSGWTLESVRWNGPAVDSPLEELGTQTSAITSNLVNFFNFSSNVQLNSTDPGRVSFTNTTDNSSYLDFTFTSASEDIIYPSTSLSHDQFIGNIFYSHGMAVLSKSNIAKRFQEQVLRSGSLEWKGSQTIFEHTYQCRSNQSQLNFTQNPSSYTNAPESGSIAGNITGSYFQPYITAVGLYNDTNELIAVGKLGQPVPKSQHTDMTFVVKFDV